MTAHAIIRDIELSEMTGLVICEEADKAYKFLEGIIEQCEQQETSHVFRLVKNDEWYIVYDYNDDLTWVSEYRIWEFFREEYGYKDDEVSELTTYILRDLLNREIPPTNPQFINIH